MTETTQITLADFILARIAEDEAMARDAVAERWRAVPSRKADEGDNDWFVRSEHTTGGGPDPEFSMTAEYICSDSGWMDEGHGSLRHIARHDPARVLAECDAKRRIVAIHYNGSDGYWPNRCSLCDTQGEPCTTLLALALPYTDHPDFCEEWKP